MKTLKTCAAVALLGACPLGAVAQSDTVIVPGPEQEYWVAAERSEPHYPKGAAMSRINGCVALRFIVEADGSPSNVTVLASYPEDLFDLAAIRALKKWRFEPGADNPGKLPALMTETFNFEIEGAKNQPVSCVPASANG